MSKVTQETINASHKPYDLVTDVKGNVGVIVEVSCNESQNPPNQISYSVRWMIGNQNKCAWWDHNELTPHGNILIKIAEWTCHPFGNNAEFVSKFFNK